MTLYFLLPKISNHIGVLQNTYLLNTYTSLIIKKKKGKYYWIHEAFPRDAKSHSYAAFVAMNEQAVYSLHTWNKEGSG